MNLNARKANTGQGSWEHFSHAADIGVRGFGDTPEQAFEQAALALTAVVTPPERVQPREAVDIRCRNPDPELLLFDWLNALIYEMAVRQMLFSRFEVHIEGAQLQARAWGEPLEPARHRPAVEIKGATFTELKLAQDASGRWVAQCVVDV
ncbi:MAG TPA: archease [Gammaproteobacteria bacterium]|nr:archease [Gammaproteobacteria bacterium]